MLSTPSLGWSCTPFLFSSLPPPSHIWKPHSCWKFCWNVMPDTEVLKSPMPAHLGIFSNEQGPTKGAAEIQRSILLAQFGKTNGTKWELTWTWDRTSFLSSSNKSSDLSCTFEKVLVTTPSRCIEMCVVWGINVFYVFSLRLLTHWIYHQMNHMWCGWDLNTEAEIWTQTSHKPKYLSSGLSFPPFPISRKAFK